MKSLKLLALTFLITTNAYSGYYDGTYEYVHYHEICSGIMEVSTFNDTAHVTLNTVCGEFARTCDFEESMNFHGNTLIHSGDDFQFNIVFHGDASTLIFSRGNEMDFGYCGMNAYMHGLYRKK
ncbi:hypothetical protein [Desulfonatronum thiosulfatophilum]|uniref:hypothetical protein n=1 Tax=Desulfonatronum thiosulfatophilum TaxID=617002 RepID=UPI0011140E8E|nr:hypothetical protein [Desulfonatronum thiosulfatophilum]